MTSEWQRDTQHTAASTMTRRVVLLAIFFAQALSLPTKGSEFCLGELKCIPAQDCPSRPLNPKPDPREAINTQFLFYSRETDGEVAGISGYRIKPDVLRNTTFNPNRPTKFVVHGWLDNLFLGKWMTSLKDALLRNGDFNVIVVDWSGGNGLPYTQASVNTRVVGAEIGLLVKKLMETFGISPSSVHAYGHSLGGHVVGYAGKWLNGTLGRITSMDPAEPLFEYCPPRARISKTDAQFVEVIHTDAMSFVPRLGLGMNLAVGDVDFYPNGGKTMPGCDARGRFVELKDKNILDGLRVVGACNHMRAIDYTQTFLENSAENSTCIPIAFACHDYDIFERGHCFDCGLDGSRCAIMSLEGAEYARRLRGKSNDTVRMYFKTGPRPPFCLFHYHIEMKLFRDPKNSAVRSVSGSLSVLINVENGKFFKFDLKHDSSDDDFTPGATYRYLITSEEAIEKVESITFNYKSSRILFPPKLYLKRLKFTPMTTANPRIDLKKLTRTFCPRNNAVASRSATDLKEAFC